MLIRSATLLIALGALGWAVGCDDKQASPAAEAVSAPGAAGSPGQPAKAVAIPSTPSKPAAAGAGVLAANNAKPVNPLFDERLDEVRAKEAERKKAGPAVLAGVTKDTPFKGKRLGFVHTANVMGELEPCG